MSSDSQTDERFVRERMRADLLEWGDFCITEMYAQIAPSVTLRTLRRFKKELLDEALSARRRDIQARQIEWGAVTDRTIIGCAPTGMAVAMSLTLQESSADERRLRRGFRQDVQDLQD